MIFTTTTGGNGICIDFNEINDEEPGIIIVDHSIFTNKGIIVFNNGIMKEHDLIYEVIKRYSLEIVKYLMILLQ